jgi:hypothetical protein
MWNRRGSSSADTEDDDGAAADEPAGQDDDVDDDDDLNSIKLNPTCTTCHDGCIFPRTTARVNPGVSISFEVMLAYIVSIHKPGSCIQQLRELPFFLLSSCFDAWLGFGSDMRRDYRRCSGFTAGV